MGGNEVKAIRQTDKWMCGWVEMKLKPLDRQINGWVEMKLKPLDRQINGWVEMKLKPYFSLERKRYFDFMLYIFRPIWKIFSTEISTQITQEFREYPQREIRIFILEVSEITFNLVL